MTAFVGTMARPVGPKSLGLPQSLVGIDRPWGGQMRRAIAQYERHGLSLAHFEIGDGGQILAACWHRCSQHGHVLPANRQPCGTIVALSHPGYVAAESEAKDELHSYLHAPAHAAHQPHD